MLLISNQLNEVAVYKLVHVILLISLISCGNYSEFLSQSDLKASRSDKATIDAPVQEPDPKYEDSNKPKESDSPPPRPNTRCANADRRRDPRDH